MVDAAGVANPGLLADALAGLDARPRRLSPKWFYDRRGSELFEAITDLPEYYPTRTEAAILRDHAGTLAGIVPPGGALVELGSGASVKTRMLLGAGRHFGAYVPIDISEGFLLSTADDLRRRYPDLAIHPVTGDFTGPVALPGAVAGMAKVGFFPGSTIGNLERAEAVDLLTRARRWQGAEAFILGADLVKPEAELIAAYDDAAGVTAAFNLNLLHRLNREAGADFDVDAFAHEVRRSGDRIEMHLAARHAQEVTLGDRTFRFDAGDTIHTESCRKYTDASLAALAADAGWKVGRKVTDARGRYAVVVLRPDAPAA